MNKHQRSILDFIKRSNDLKIAEKKIIANAVTKIEDELAHKKRDLEIESSLERVRAVALRMKTRDDMLEVCRMISEQLQKLNVKDIRNVQTAIFYEAKGTYMNYEYYALHRKTFITETSYTNHKIHKAFAAQMLKGKGKFYSTHIKGKKVKDWIAYQKTTNVFVDKYLEKTASLSYYWYSLGAVALGTSTYTPLSEDDMNLFKRFLKVFELSYRRYLDIEKAEAQAHEAKIEASLERVRAQAMGMRKAEDLLNICETLFREFNAFGFADLRNAMINIHNDEDKIFVNYDYSDVIGKSTNLLDYDIHPVIEKQIKQMRGSNDAFSETVFAGKDLAAWKKFRKKIGEKDDPRISKARALYYYFYSIGTGAIGISTFSPVGEEKLQLLKRFRNVFNLSYQRYTDIKQAEEQARESQIQLALERVRARTMAMQKSAELSETAAVLFREFKKLGEEDLLQITIGIYNEEEGLIEFNVTSWAGGGKPENRSFNMSIEEPTLLKPVFTAWKEQKKSIVVDLKGKELDDWVKYRNAHSGVTIQSHDTAGRRVVSVAFFSKGHISFSSPEPKPPETIQLLERFAAVFEQTYTRFLDLQKAEAQAREAQIEASLERVRGKAMAMHNSEDLSEAVNVFFKELKSLGITPIRCGVGRVDDETRTSDLTVTTSSQQGDSFQVIGKLKQAGHPVLEGIYNHWKLQKEYHPVLKGADIKAYYRVTKNQIGFPDYDENVTQYGNMFYFKEGFVFAWTEKELSEEELKIFRRFTSVLSLTYRRYTDLKEAEAQAKEAKLELSLERIRARTMAMHNSQELVETSALLFHELKTLDIETIRTGFAIMDEAKQALEIWSWQLINGKENRVLGIVPVNIHPFFKGYYKSWKGKDLFFSYSMAGDEVKKYYHVMSSFISYPEGMKFNSKETFYTFFFPEGSLNVISGETLSEPVCNVMLRFTRVFGLIYRRFLDLKKAEAQSRDAQIELSLERVRAKTMAMHNSQDVGDTITTMFHELVTLGISTNRCGILIYSDTPQAEVWTARSHPDGKAVLTIGQLDLMIHPLLQGTHKAWKNKESVYTYHMAGDDLRNYYEAINNEQYYPSRFDMDALPSEEFHSDFYFPEGSIFAFTKEPITAEASQIFKRFAGVFGQTYRRYLDLQKAEAQSREAQIELALERVRARTMAMHKSEEFMEVINLVSEQLQLLNIVTHIAGFSLDYKAHPFNIWMAAPGQPYPSNIDVPYREIPMMQRIKKATESGMELYSDTFSFEEKNQWLDNVLENTIIKYASEERKKFMLNAVGISITIVMQRQIALMMGNYAAIPYTDAENAILKRFAMVFEQTYTRYLDLQKAEAQAREAQIEAALEKVRGKAMAMHSSGDISVTTSAVFTELKKLGVDPIRSGVALYAKDPPSATFYASTTSSENDELAIIGSQDVSVNPCLQMQYDSWIRKENYFPVLSGQELKDYYEALSIRLTDHAHPDESFQHVEYGYYFNFSEGNFYAWTETPFSEDEINILNRFRSIIDLTFRRYLDLQKAEAQAREAQTEAALERVRSRSMGMQKSAELKEVIQVVYEQFVHLNIRVEHTGFIMDYKERDDMHIWLADQHAVPFQVTIPYFDCAHWNSFNEAKEKGLDFFANHLTFEEKNKFYQDLFKLIPGVPEETLEYYFSCPGLAKSTVLLENIGLYIENFSGIPYTDEENATLMRFGKVFQQTYTRFNDLKQAEAQALEAIKRASVDRVRAEIASMRTTNDLEKITPIIWNELTTLGVPFIRCGVFIMDEQQQQVQTFLSTPDGKAIAAFRQPYNTPGETAQIIAHWRKKEIYKQHWDEAAFIDFTTNLVEQGAMAAGEKYVTENRPTNLYLHFLPFLQGMLYAGSETPLNEDELQLVQNLAEAFSTAYARYDDFNKLESAKGQIEKTLVDLKQAQAQLVQSEKMASLGELTAGIAHEIQNPLNFVNNFSEVNTELIQEMKEEIAKGNLEDVKAIANDISENEQKINHHGKRAEAIVKGMLQHSRTSSGVKEPTNINALADEYLRLAYHGFRAKDKTFNAVMKTDYDETIGLISIIPQDIGRVILNLITNAFYVVTEKKEQSVSAKATADKYEPTVSVSTKKSGDKVLISVKDNGSGIPKKVMDKIFQPFFTTKPTGQGTGLGLSLSYDIIKAHGGEIKVETKEGEGTEFTISLPDN